MAISAAIEWDVQSGGDDTFGGGFTAGAAGVDRSTATAAFVVVDGVTITAVVQATTTDLLLVGYAPTGNNDVGNTVNISSGATAGLYEIQSIQGGNTWRLDRSCGTAAQSAVAKMGGCLATPNKIMSEATAVVAGQTIHIKNATYTRTTTISLGASGTAAAGWITVRGYNAAHNDITTWAQLANAPILTTATNSIAKVSTNSKTMWFFEAIKITDTAATRGIGINGTGASTIVGAYLIQFDGCISANSAATGTFTAQFDMFEVKNSTSFGIRSNVSFLSNGWIHANAGGIKASASGSRLGLSRVYITDNTANGVELAAETSPFIADCVIALNTGGTTDGIQVSTAISGALQLHNTILWGNGRYNLNFVAASLLGPVYVNAWGGAGTGNTNGTGASTGKNPITLTGSPFTSASDYSLNTTAGAGALCRALGFPGIFPGASFTGYADVGGIQHQDSGGAAGMLYTPNLEGI